ncbi:MAG: thioredoxin family protein [Pirellulales bacterium]|nr:thioredoxin family protein [Pirellulales bacterium]
MSTVALLMMNMMLASEQPRTYAEAYRQTNENGKPLVVLVGTKWCPGCIKMKEEVIPQMQEHGTLSKVNFTEVDAETDTELAGQLLNGRKLPQLVMFIKTDSGWKKTQMVGAKSEAEIDAFLQNNMAKPTVRFSSVQTPAR